MLYTSGIGRKRKEGLGEPTPALGNDEEEMEAPWHIMKLALWAAALSLGMAKGRGFFLGDVEWRGQVWMGYGWQVGSAAWYRERVQQKGEPVAG